ncbi:MAG: N-acetyltransferase [Bacteroidetes bacterium]|nr:MAG: N-acetyltransferase [Bacteroidota bacterium]
MHHLTILEEDIPVDIYRHLRSICGLSDKTPEAAAIGLSHSTHSVMIKMDDQIIGMGRIVGDGGCFCQVVDICVHPDQQGKGIGKLILQNLTDFIQEKLPPSCYVSLLADGDAWYLYEKFGFRDTLPESKGMYLKK